MGRFWWNVVIGFIIGLGGVLPGVSGGVMAVSFGVYEGMVSAVSTFFRDPKRHIRFLFPLVLGGGIGALVVTLLLQSLYTAYEPQIVSLFMGMVMGCLPELIQGCGKQPVRPAGVLTGVLCLSVIVGVSILGSLLPGVQEGNSLTFFSGAACGLILAVGTVLPGISGSFVMIFLGLYQPMLNAVRQVQIIPLLGLGLTFLLVALLLLRGVDRVLRRFPGPAAFSMLGFTLGSVVLVLWEMYPRLTWLCLPLAAAGFLIARLQNALPGKETVS